MILLSRCFWAAVALGLTFASAAFFDRFDSARAKAPQAVPEAPAVLTEAPANQVAARAAGGFAPVSLSRVSLRFRFVAVLAAELRLMLKGQRWWWYVVAAGLAIASGAGVSPAGRGMVLAFAWIWPVLLWSQMGVRELREQTRQLLFSTPHPLARQLPAIWLAGFVVAALTGSGFALRLMIGGNAHGFLVWLIGALFIPTFALALGVWSGSSKLFEILYVLLWYVGPIKSIVPFDFMGALPVTTSTRYPMIYLALTCALAIAGLVGRKRQLQT